MHKIIRLLITFVFLIEGAGIKSLWANPALKHGWAHPALRSKALRPPSSDSQAGKIFTGILGSVDRAADSEPAKEIDPEKLLALLGREKEIAVIDMSYELASEGKRFIPNRALKLFYPACGGDLSALMVALLLIDKDAIDYAELYMVDLEVFTDSIIEEAQRIRPFVEDLKIETEQGMPKISMRYKGRLITMRFYQGDDEKVIAKLPKDMNLLFYHGHGFGGLMPYIFRAIWEAFIKHCQGPVVIFSYGFPEPLIEMMADWEYRTYKQFDRWCTVMPMYSGGVAIGLEPPLDLELVKKAWSDFDIEPEQYIVNMRIPTENIDRLFVQRSLKKLRNPIKGLYDENRQRLIRFFEQDRLSYDEVQKIWTEVFPVREYLAFIHHPSGLHREIVSHGCAANLRYHGVDISKSPKERLEQIASKIKDKNLSDTERTFLLDMFLYVGGQIDPSSIAELYEEAGSPDGIRRIESAFFKSPKDVFDLRSQVYRELARRVERTKDVKKLRRYLAIFIDLNRADRKSILRKHPQARKRLFKTTVFFLCEQIRREGINIESYRNYKEIANWLIEIDLDRALKFINMSLSMANLISKAGFEQARAAHMPIIDAVNEYIFKGGELTKTQKKMLNKAESQKWPKRLSARERLRHIEYFKNIELCGYLKRTFGYELKANRVIDAMMRTPRHLFMFWVMKEWAYLDIAMPIMNEQTISQPKTVVDMARHLDLNEGDRVSEIGTGSGWNTAIMSRLVGQSGHIYSIEIDNELAQFATENLSRLKIQNVTIYGGRDGSMGLAEKAPFDAIIFTCAVPLDPDRLQGFLENIGKQLKVGGRVVFPISVEEGPGVLEFAQKTGEDSWKTRPLGYVGFVPMQGRLGHRVIKVDSRVVDKPAPAIFPDNAKTLTAIQSSA